MKITLKQIIGILMMIVFFGALFYLIARNNGFLEAAIVFGIAIVGVTFLFISMRLIAK